MGKRARQEQAAGAAQSKLEVQERIRMRVGFEGGNVRVTLSRPVEWVTMSAADALHLSTLLRLRAEALILAAEEGAR